MRRSTARVIAALTVSALAAATGLATATVAGAATVATSITASSANPTIFTGTANQAVGDLTLAALPNNVATNDTITIALDDSDVGVNCATATDTVLFASLPTVTTSTGAAVALTPTLTSSAGCTAGTLRDTLTLTASAAITTMPVVKISNLRVSVGTDAATGAVRTSVNGSGFSATNSPATISAVQVASTNPALLLAPSTNQQSIASVTLTEKRAGAIGAGGACITITLPTGGTGTTFHTTPTPTVAASGGNGVPGTVTATANSVSFVVTTPSTTATTYTLNGLLVDTGSKTGPIDARAGSTCPANDFAQQVRLAFIGTVDRLAGSNRYATAQKIAEAGPCVAGKAVILARGDDYPDALAASFLAGKTGVPILLTMTSSVPTETFAALQHIGATSVTIVGGPNAVSPFIDLVLAHTPAYNCGGATTTGNNLTVDRAWGPDRYGTARAVALRGGTAGTSDLGLTLDGSDCAPATTVATAIVASGENFPDALAGGPLAAKGFLGCGSGSLPLLLTRANSLPSDTANTISDLGIKQVILLGGPSAVSTGVETAINALPGVSARRIAGVDRQDTAVQISKVEGSVIGGWVAPTTTRVFVARGDTFPDALAAGPLAGRLAAPLFLSQLTTQLGTTAASGITTYANGKFVIVQATLLGGTAALSDTVAAQTATALASQPTPT